MDEITNWEDLPITTSTTEHKDGWWRTVEKQGSIYDLLQTWEIDKEEKHCEMSQVLLLLRTYFYKYTNLINTLKAHKIIP